MKEVNDTARRSIVDLLVKTRSSLFDVAALASSAAETAMNGPGTKQNIEVIHNPNLSVENHLLLVVDAVPEHA